MIQTKIQYSLRTAKVYFREHLCVGDYYTENQHLRGEWFGIGAQKLGLSGNVNEKEFLFLCEGKHPLSGNKLGARMNTIRREAGKQKANRRIFFDFTIAPPKSVSIAALVCDERIIKLHEESVKLVMTELEKFSESRVRKAGENTERIAGNVVGAYFQHETSRELDPHLHTHCLVFNATYDPVEQRWKALSPAGMYRAHRYATNLYRHELCKGLKELGYEVVQNKNGFELKGISEEMIKKFSKRHQQIDEEAEEALAEGFDGDMQQLRWQIAHGNRRRKLKHANKERLRPGWLSEMTPTEKESLKQLIRRDPTQKTLPQMSELLEWSEKHIFERNSTAQKHELMAAALERGRGMNFSLKELRNAIDQRGYLQEDDKLTTKEVLKRELAVVHMANEGCGKYRPLKPGYTPDARLTEEQAAAVKQILGSRDLITLFRGGAGTGKSFTLKAVCDGLRDAEHPITILAPQRQQVDGLKKDGLDAETLSLLLERKTLAEGSVVIVDEAGQIGASQMLELLKLVKGANGRLILSGDTRQHGAVAASDALVLLERHAELKAAQIKEIRRQDPKLAASLQEEKSIREYKKAVKAASDGDIAESFQTLDDLGCIRETSENKYEELVSEYMKSLDGTGDVLVVSQTRAEVLVVNEKIRQSLLESGRLGMEAKLLTYQAVDLSEAQKQDSKTYEFGQNIVFLKRYGRFKKGDVVPVMEANEKGLLLKKGRTRSLMSYRYANRFCVVQKREMNLSEGDKLQLKFNGKSIEGRQLNNGELVTVQKIQDNGAITVSSGKELKTLSPSQRMFSRGYAVTSYGSQGKTVDTVLVMDSGSRLASNAKQWYVSISRGRKKVLVFTPDKELLRIQVQQSGKRELAMDMKPTCAIDSHTQVRAQRPFARSPRRRHSAEHSQNTIKQTLL